MNSEDIKGDSTSDFVACDLPAPASKPKRKAYREEKGPRHFAVLNAAYRDRAVPIGDYGHYYEVERDDPAANEFRVQMLIEHGEINAPLGRDRERAESMVELLNQAYHFGRVQAERRAKDVRTPEVLVGRMGHRNRNEELMP